MCVFKTVAVKLLREQCLKGRHWDWSGFFLGIPIHRTDKKVPLTNYLTSNACILNFAADFLWLVVPGEKFLRIFVIGDNRLRLPSEVFVLSRRFGIIFWSAKENV